MTSKTMLMLLVLACVTVAYGSKSQGCVHLGITYQPGERFIDDCNSCTCGNGVAGCTYKGCPPKVCEMDGKRYGAGERWLAWDDCNTCICFDDGTTACTNTYCI